MPKQTLTLDGILEEATGRVIWVTQATLDNKIKLPRERILDILKQTTDKDGGHYIGNPEYQRKANDLIRILQQRDVDGEIKDLRDEELEKIERLAKEFVPRTKWVTEIGGSPAISAIAAYTLNNGLSQQRIFFIGNLTGTVKDFLSRAQAYGPLFKYAIDTGKTRKHKPRTTSLEEESGTFKIMMAYSSGRKLQELDRGEFTRGILNASSNGGTITIGWGGLNKGEPEEYKTLVETITDLFRDGRRPINYIGTNSFMGYYPGKLIKYLELINTAADIVSFNDEELRQIYDKLGMPRNNQTQGNLTDLLVGLDELMEKNGIEPNREQIRICHSSSGAIAYVPDRLSQYKNAIKEALQKSVDGATYTYLERRNPSARDIETYTQTTNCNRRGRQTAKFRRDFGAIGPNSRVISAIAPKVTNAKGSTTGLGAVFDGILSVYISAIYSHHSRQP